MITIYPFLFRRSTESGRYLCAINPRGCLASTMNRNGTRYENRSGLMPRHAELLEPVSALHNGGGPYFGAEFGPLRHCGAMPASTDRMPVFCTPAGRSCTPLPRLLLQGTLFVTNCQNPRFYRRAWISGWHWGSTSRPPTWNASRLLRRLVLCGIFPTHRC